MLQGFCFSVEIRHHSGGFVCCRFEWLSNSGVIFLLNDPGWSSDQRGLFWPGWHVAVTLCVNPVTCLGTIKSEPNRSGNFVSCQNWGVCGAPAMRRALEPSLPKWGILCLGREAKHRKRSSLLPEPSLHQAEVLSFQYPEGTTAYVC